MNSQKTITVGLMAGLILALIPQTAQAQRLYNKERDDQAQAALPLAKVLESGALFDKQLKNFASLAKKDFDTEFLVTKFQINAFSLNLLTWADVHTLACQTEDINTDAGSIPKPEQIKAAQAQLKTSIEAAQTSLEDFKKSIKAKPKDNEGNEEEEQKDKSVLATLFNSLGELDSLKEFAEQLGSAPEDLVNSKTIESIQRLQEIAVTLKTVYDAYKKKVDEFNKLQGDLADLRLVLKKVAIQSLQVDEEHWKNIASIRARREVERGDVLALISQYKGLMKSLKIVEYPSPLPGRISDRFCTVAQNPEGSSARFLIKPSQLITEHLKELVTLSASMEGDNKAIENEAQIALKNIGSASSESNRKQVIARTVQALSLAIKNINLADSTHGYQEEIGAAVSLNRETLMAAVQNSNQETIKALVAVIIMTRNNSVKLRDMVADIPQALFIMAALIARGSTPTKLADIRFAQELHAYSIRKSAVRARAYELTISTGVQRLALFHQGGIKPTDVAELVFAASNIAITPAILKR